MKLNLLPTTVSKGKQAKSSVVFSVIIALAGVGTALFFAQSSEKDLQAARYANTASQGPASDAYNRANVADAIMTHNVGLIKNALLAKAMIDHNDVYPNLYDSIIPYIPTFYRVNSMSAQSASGMATVTLVGTIKTYQQYADLMLCFSRYPGVLSVGRAGYQFNDNIVPNLTPTDQTGTPHKPGESPVPDDKLQRLAYFQSQAQPEGYTGAGNFGTGTDNTRSAMPGYSLVTVTLTIAKDLRTPLPRTTLSSGGGGGTAATTTGPSQGAAASFGKPAATQTGGDTETATPKAGKKGKAGDDTE